jgi:DNA-binding beta-propeller fold protein YncE
MWSLLGIAILLGSTFLLFSLGSDNHVAANNYTTTNQSYFPIINRALPTPTPIPSPTPASPPVFLNNIALAESAQCPNAVGVNEYTGYVYVANSQSSNVSLLKDGAFLTNVPTSKTPTYIASIPNTAYTYVTNLTDQPHPQIAFFEGAKLIQMLPDYFEPVDVIYNPVNKLTYISDLDSTIRVFDKNVQVGDIHIPDGGWLMTLAVDEKTGYVYTAGWEKGRVYVIDGMELIETFDAGWGTYRITIDQERGYIYLAHSEPSNERPQNITIFHRDDRTLTAYRTAARSYWVAVDKDGYAYYPNYSSNSVTIVRGREMIGTVVVGAKPRTAASNLNTGYTMVTIEGENKAALFKAGQLLEILPAGQQPWAVTTNQQTGEFFVANRSYYTYCDPENRCYLVCNPASISHYK